MTPNTVFSRLHKWRYVVFINKMSFSWGKEVLQCSVNSSAHWISGFLWSFISVSFDSFILCPWEKLSRSISTMAKIPGRTLTSASRKVTAVVPKAVKDLISPTCTNGQLDHSNSWCLVCPWSQGWLWAYWEAPWSTVKPVWWRTDRERLSLFQL